MEGHTALDRVHVIGSIDAGSQETGLGVNRSQQSFAQHWTIL